MGRFWTEHREDTADHNSRLSAFRVSDLRPQPGPQHVGAAMADFEMTDMVTLRSADKENYEVEVEVAFESNMIKHMIEEVGIEAPIPLPNVNANILSKVIEYCRHHVAESKKPEEEREKQSDGDEFSAWDNEFVKVEMAMLFELILAANFLNIKSLLELTCQHVANMMKGKTPDEIRTTFNIKNDFTPEEEEEVRRENQWAFE